MLRKKLLPTPDSFSALPNPPTTVPAQRPRRRLAPEGRFSVRGAGDGNADGYDDFIVGAPEYATTPHVLEENGQAHVFSGKDGKTLYTVTGTYWGDHLGREVSGAGDVNADG